MKRLGEIAKAAATGELHRNIARDAGLEKATVRCEDCGASQEVDGAECLRSGWPKCCGQTMRVQS